MFGRFLLSRTRFCLGVRLRPRSRLGMRCGLGASCGLRTRGTLLARGGLLTRRALHMGLRTRYSLLANRRLGMGGLLRARGALRVSLWPLCCLRTR
jgi:hypothetical protein